MGNLLPRFYNGSAYEPDLMLINAAKNGDEKLCIVAHNREIGRAHV